MDWFAFWLYLFAGALTAFGALWARAALDAVAAHREHERIQAELAAYEERAA